MTPLERTLLRYLADNQFCSTFEFIFVAHALDSRDHLTYAQLLVDWESRGWVEFVPNLAEGIDPEQSEAFALLYLTDAALAEMLWLQAAS